MFGSPIVADGLVVAGVGSYEVLAPGDPPTFRGHVVALDAATGTEAWRFWVTAGDASEVPGVSIWSSPAIDADRGVLYIGTGQAYALPAPPAATRSWPSTFAPARRCGPPSSPRATRGRSPSPRVRDADVGATPNLFTVDGTDAVGVGDKAGTFRALGRESGEVVWGAPVEDRLTIEQHRSVVQDGRGRMPDWAGSLSAEEIEAVVEYERTVLSRGGG